MIRLLFERNPHSTICRIIINEADKLGLRSRKYYYQCHHASEQLPFSTCNHSWISKNNKRHSFKVCTRKMGFINKLYFEDHYNYQNLMDNIGKCLERFGLI